MEDRGYKKQRLLCNVVCFYGQENTSFDFELKKKKFPELQQKP